MGRIGVTYLEVVNVASELQGKGINPTVDNVREILQTGSRSTIGPYLKQWRTKQEEGGRHPGLPPELSSLVKGLYERLQEEADAKVEAAENSAKVEIASIQEKLTLSITHTVTLEQEVQALSQQLTTTQGANEQLKLEFERERNDNFSLTTKLQEFEIRYHDKEQQNKLLEKQLDTVQKNLEHYRESMQVQREQEKRAFEREIFLLNQEITQFKQQLAENKAERTTLTQKVEILQNEKQQLEKDWYEQRGKTMELQEQIKLKDFVVESTEDKYNSLKIDYQKCQDNLIKIQQSFHVMEKELLLSEEKLKAIEDFRTKAEDRICELLHKNDFLTQENIELRQQMKILKVNL